MIAEQDALAALRADHPKLADLARDIAGSDAELQTRLQADEHLQAIGQRYLQLRASRVPGERDLDLGRRIFEAQVELVEGLLGIDLEEEFGLGGDLEHTVTTYDE